MGAFFLLRAVRPVGDGNRTRTGVIGFGQWRACEILARDPMTIVDEIGMPLHRLADRRIERWRQDRGDDAEHKGIRRTGFRAHQKWLPAEDRCQRFHIADGEFRDVGSRVTADTVSMKPPGVHSTQH